MATDEGQTRVILDKRTNTLQIVDSETGEIVQHGPTNLYNAEKYAFNYDAAMKVFAAIASGKSLTEIDEDPRLPDLPVIQHWQRSYPMFKETMKIARKERAALSFEKIYDVAKSAAKGHLSKDEVANQRLAMDAFKYIAEKGDPQEFSQKVVHEGSDEKPITMRVINTGIDRSKPDIIINSEEQHDGNSEKKRLESAQREVIQED